MNKKYLMKGFAALMLIAGFSSCVKDVTNITPAEQEEKAKENAELMLGLNIPDGQSWNMSAQVTANVSVNKKAGETYRVTVYSNNPLADGKGVFLTRGTISNGETFTGKFTCGAGVKSLYVGLTDSKGYTVYKEAAVENNRLDLSFDNPSAGARRSYTIKGDTYSQFDFPTQEELAAAFPTSVPGNAEEIAEDGNYDYYFNRGAGYNYKITADGTYNIGGSWQNSEWVADQNYPNGGYTLPHPYNVYVDVDGDVTITRNGNAQFNLYILRGNVTIPSNFSEMGCIISVAAGATFNDGRNSLSNNFGVKLYNRGIVNATNTEKYDIGNNAIFYNEGAFNVTGPLTYSAGAGQTSYFYNLGNNIEVNGEEVAKLTAPSMTLNSTCNFITNGDVEIAGETAVTQSGIVWVNNGKYHTGSLRFSAQNSTFYNYCQLLIDEDIKFLDGEFNMMTGSYAKMKYGMFNNFIVNMADNSGIEITDGTKWGRQGQGTFQGFKAVDDNAVAYVRLGGQQYVPSHNGAAFHLQGAHLTAAIENMKFYNSYNEIGQYSTYSGIGYWDETSAEKLAGDQDGRITWDIHNAQVAPIAAATFAPLKEGECSATWEEKKVPVYDKPQVYSYAFEDQIYNGDYDMNDIVLKVTFPSTENSKGEVIAIDSTKLQITMVAAGATFKIKAFVDDTPLFDGQEIHDAFGVNQGVMVNTGNGKAQTATPVVDVIDIPAGIIDSEGNADFTQLNVWIWVNDHIAEGENSSNQKIYYLTDKEKPTPYAIMVPQDWRWPLERICITEAYPGAKTATEGVYNTEYSFATWAETPDVSRTDAMREWFKHYVEGKTMTNE